MRIILLTDLHIQSDSTCDNLPWIKHFCYFLNKTCYPDTLIFVLGDIVHCGNKAAFEAADSIFSYIESQLLSVRHKIVFIPGNHDYCEKSLNEFFCFCQRYQHLGGTIFDFSKKSVWNYSRDKLNFIFADSVQNGEHSIPGKLEISGIQECILPGKNNILFMHHSLFFEDLESHTGIIEQTEAIDFLKQNKFEYVFHGHTHITRPFRIEGNCSLYGIGPIGTVSESFNNEDEQFFELQTHGDKIEAIARWQWHDGTANYEKSLIYPDNASKYGNKELMSRKKYIMPENYIKRYVMPRGIASEDELTRSLYDENKCTLFDACMKEQLVLLIADAGFGKTVEMQCLAYAMTSDNQYVRPILLTLNAYKNGSLTDYIYLNVPEYETLDPNQFFLIMDGYDELEDPKAFKSALSQYLLDAPSVRICISMRSNFLPAHSNVFEKFAVYQLLELRHEDVKNKLSEHGIKEQSFYNECQKQNLLNLLRIPFYLDKLIDIYLSDQSLPKQQEFIKRFFEIQFAKDSAKFEFAISLEDCQYETKRALRRFAYGLQLLNCTYCDDETYQGIIEKQDRQYIKYSSLTINTPN